MLISGSTSTDGDPAGEIVNIEGTGTANNNTVVAPFPEKPDLIESSVDIQASFDGNWSKFLLRNLDGNTPIVTMHPQASIKY